MKLLSFVGTGKYQKTTYFFGDREVETKYVQEAIVRIFGIEKAVLFCTERAKETNLDGVKNRLEAAGVEVEVADIPDGLTNEEHWEIFRIINERVEKVERVIFDVTHAFRSIPFISFLAVLYFKELRGIEVERVVYGALEAGTQGRAPLVDMRDFAEVAECMMGVREFLRYGYADNLRDILRKVQRRAYSEGWEEKPRSIGNLGDSLERFSKAVHYARVRDALRYAQDAVQYLPEAERELGRFIPPLKEIVDEIASLERMAFSRDELSPLSLKASLEVIRFQIERGLILQAVELAREWFVNYLILRLGCEPDKWLLRDVRIEVERTLGAEINRRRGREAEETKFSERFAQLEDREELVKTWDRITSLRNDLAHCGMNPNPANLSKLERRGKEILEKLDYLASRV